MLPKIGNDCVTWVLNQLFNYWYKAQTLSTSLLHSSEDHSSSSLPVMSAASLRAMRLASLLRNSSAVTRMPGASSRNSAPSSPEARRVLGASAMSAMGVEGPAHIYV